MSTLGTTKKEEKENKPIQPARADGNTEPETGGKGSPNLATERPTKNQKTEPENKRRPKGQNERTEGL